MHIKITSRHFNASPGLHDNLRQEVEKLGRFNGSITGAHVMLDAEALTKKAEIVLNISDKSLCATAEEDNMHKAIDLMLARAEKQLKKENEKHKIHKSLPMDEVVHS